MDEDLRSAKERGWEALESVDVALARGEIDETEWHTRIRRLVEASYVAADTPEGQSGHSGDALQWERARRLILDAVDGQGGSFLDVGCANGLLMESVFAWSDGTLEPFGVEISPALAELARRRCPQWSDRIWTANARHFRPARKFTYVRTGLDYAPAGQRAGYVGHLLSLVDPGGRLIVGAFNEEVGVDALADEVASWGFVISGRASRPHRHPGLAYKAFWIDADESCA